MNDELLRILTELKFKSNNLGVMVTKVEDVDISAVQCSLKKSLTLIFHYVGKRSATCFGLEIRLDSCKEIIALAIVEAYEYIHFNKPLSFTMSRDIYG